ncbi:hypothetical protein G5I_12835 [Acromyrmex echinatior]|uniref:Uncharacterized protein n=1 Tax=Acromyrmex echinatior TaxID=103372 RepID=F4X3F2_ACREC|nr:hypothetical protein G5I_12835 [Acromyrmex echinatior]
MYTVGSGAIKIMAMDSAKCDSSHKSASASHGPDVAALYARSRKTKGHSDWNFSAVLRGHPSGRRRDDPSWLERVTITGKHVLGINYHPNARILEWYAKRCKFHWYDVLPKVFTDETLSRTRMMLSLVDADRDNPRRHVKNVIDVDLLTSPLIHLRDQSKREKNKIFYDVLILPRLTPGRRAVGTRRKQTARIHADEFYVPVAPG